MLLALIACLLCHYFGILKSLVYCALVLKHYKF
jgi:hypothetical protein